MQSPVGSDAVHAVAGLLLSRDGLGPPARRPHHARPAGLDGVGRVGEVDGAVGLNNDVIGAVEPLALKMLRQHRASAVVGDSRHAAAVVLRREHASLPIQRQAVGHTRGEGGQFRTFR